MPVRRRSVGDRTSRLSPQGSAVAGDASRAPTAEQAQPVEPTRHVEAAHRPHPRGGQFDRQRQTVEPAADLGDRAHRLMVEVEIRPACPGPLGEQLSSRRRPAAAELAGSARPPPRALPYSLPARRHADSAERSGRPTARPQQGRARSCPAAIAACASAGTRSRWLRCRGPAVAAASTSRQRRATDGRTVIERRELAEPRAVVELFLESAGDLESESGLPDPSDAGQRHQWTLSDSADDACDVVLASDEAGDPPRYAAARSSGDRNLRCGRYDMVSGIAVEYQLVHLAQRRARICTQLLDESFAHRAECLERVGLSATTELGQHQLTGKPFVERMVRSQRDEKWQQFALATDSQTCVVAVQSYGEPLGFQRGADVVRSTGCPGDANGTPRHIASAFSKRASASAGSVAARA